MYHQLISCRARVPIGGRGAREQSLGGRTTRAVIDTRAVHHITSVSPYSFVASTGEVDDDFYLTIVRARRRCAPYESPSPIMQKAHT